MRNPSKTIPNLLSINLILLILIASTLSSNNRLLAQVEVKDKKHNKWSKVIQSAKTASLVISTKVNIAVSKIKKAQEYISKAHTIISQSVENVRMINQIFKIGQEVTTLVNNSIDAINEPRDFDNDGIDDLHYINKWKHIQILLAIGGQFDNVFELFKNVLESDRAIMDDKGRLKIISDAYQDARKIRSSIKIQLRRINKEIYQYKRQRREVQLFSELFSN